MADKDLLDDAREQFKQAEESASENRAAALEDIKFARMAEQWDERDKTRREKKGRPCLTINRLPAFVRQVVNDCRQNKPSIIVHPASDKADVETASIITGLIRNIEASSDADVAYDTAVEAAAYGGFGFFRVDIDYAHDDAFDLDILVRRIANPMTVYFDPRSTAADSSDWRYAFVTEMLPVEDFKRQYRDAATESFDGDKDERWFTDETVRVAEWWQRDEVMRRIVKLSDGSVVGADKWQENQDLFVASGLQVVGERDVRSYQVTQRVVTGAEVLSETSWSGRYIPIIPVFGEEVNVEGKRYFRSLIRDARDPQKMFNLWRSTSTELVALSPRVPFIGPRGAFATDADKWSTINRENHPYVEYDGPTPPQRMQLDSGAAAGAMQEALTAADDMKAILGIFDAGLGAKSNETSGIAITNRKRESDTSTFHIIDNLNRAVRHAGRVILDLIPNVYTGERVLRVMGEDGSPSHVQVGQQQMPQGMPPQGPQMPQGAMPMPGQPTMPPMPGMPPQGAPMPPQGMPPQGMQSPQQMPPFHKVYDLTVGRYDVVVKSGPSFGTRREEAAAQQIATLQAVPQLAPMMIDILANNLDWPQADKLKARIEQQMANPGPNPEIVKAQAAGQLEQMKAQAQGQLEQAKLQAQAQIKQLEAQTNAQLESIRSKAEVDKAGAMAQVEIEKARMQSLLDQERAAADNAAKAAIEQEKIASAERIKASELAARRQEKLLELAAGILASRSGIRGQNISNDTTLDQTGAAVGGQPIGAVMDDIMAGADVVHQVVSGIPRVKKPKKARFRKVGDAWEAEQIED